MRHFCLIGLLLSLAVSLHGQSREGAYIKVDYLLVESGDIESFLNQARSAWNELQEARVEACTMTRWQLYRVVFPGLSGRRHNFVSVEVGAGLDDLEAPDLETSAAWREELMPLLALKNVVHSELWKTVSTVQKNPDMRPSRYLNPNYMQVTPGKTEEYIEMETEFARPVHEWLTRDGRREGWEFYRIVLPGGANQRVEFIAADLYSGLEEIKFGFTPAIVEEVHGDRVFEFGDLRQALWSEIWELVDYVMPANPKE